LSINPSGDNKTVRISVKLKSDLSAAVINNIMLRIGDVNGEFNTTPAVPVDPSEHYVRSGLTNIKSGQNKAAYNYPNPFNPRNRTTNIVFYSPAADGSASIKIFTITGRLVKKLSVNAQAGSNEVEWDGKNGRGQVVRNGVYVAVIQTGGSKMMVKIAVVK